MVRMTIGEFADRAGLTPKALRLYDEMGLVVPAEVDPTNGYRYYAAGQLDRARLVARLRLVGMPLARIRRVAELSPQAAAAELASYWRQVEADTRTRRTRVLALVEELRERETPMSTTTMTADSASRMAQGKRTEQEDALHTGPDLWVVADGAGNSRGAAEAAMAAFVAADRGGDPTTAMDTAVAAAQQAVEQLGLERSAGTTLTAVRLVDGAIAVAHVGDSRAWLVRDGELTQLTHDHTEVQSLIDEGSLTEEEARTDERRFLLNRALNSAGLPPEADVFVVPVREGDRLVLTTDGVHAVLTAEELTRLVSSGAPEATVASVADAVERDGAPDNYAVVVADVR